MFMIVYVYYGFFNILTAKLFCTISSLNTGVSCWSSFTVSIYGIKLFNIWSMQLS